MRPSILSNPLNEKYGFSGFRGVEKREKSSPRAIGQSKPKLSDFGGQIGHIWDHFGVILVPWGGSFSDFFVDRFFEDPRGATRGPKGRSLDVCHRSGVG